MCVAIIIIIIILILRQGFILSLNSVSSYFSSSGGAKVTGLHSLASHLPGKGLGTGCLDGVLAKAFFSLLLTALPH